jgi:hypothetical protein
MKKTGLSSFTGSKNGAQTTKGTKMVLTPHVQNSNPSSWSAKNNALFENFSEPLAQPEGIEVDSLERFRGNIQRLEDLNSRMRFMMREISYLISRVK